MVVKRNVAAAVLGVTLLVGGNVPAAANFKDVPSNHWARGVIDWGYRNGLSPVTRMGRLSPISG